MDTTPIWFCLVEETVHQRTGVLISRIVEAIPCTFDDVERLYKERGFRVYGLPSTFVRYFHRDAADSPLLEASRRSDSSLVNDALPQDQRHEVAPCEPVSELATDTYEDAFREHYKDW